jgi:hypothetical protein
MYVFYMARTNPVEGGVAQYTDALHAEGNAIYTSTSLGGSDSKILAGN